MDKHHESDPRSGPAGTDACDSGAGAGDAVCCPPAHKTDWLLLGSATTVVLAYATHVLAPPGSLPPPAMIFTHSTFEFMNTMWWGLLLGIVFVGILNNVPRDLVLGVLGHRNGINGILRATAAGLLLDLCSHGILLVGLKLYERGASLGQVMAFLIASPWNSLSLTIILVSLIGFKWTLVFIVLSAVIAVVSGLVFERLVARASLPENPYRDRIEPPDRFWDELGRQWNSIDWTPHIVIDVIKGGFQDSRMILRWLLLGVVLAAAIRTFLSPEAFQSYFGPTLLGLGLTLVAATIIEVCSEGSSPIAADLLNRGGAPGNAFTFLMAGAATDYTEIMGLKERTGSWKIALFLPLVTVPQVVVLGYILNLLG